MIVFLRPCQLICYTDESITHCRFIARVWMDESVEIETSPSTIIVHTVQSPRCQSEHAGRSYKHIVQLVTIGSRPSRRAVIPRSLKLRSTQAIFRLNSCSRELSSGCSITRLRGGGGRAAGDRTTVSSNSLSHCGLPGGDRSGDEAGDEKMPRSLARFSCLITLLGATFILFAAEVGRLLCSRISIGSCALRFLEAGSVSAAFSRPPLLVFSRGGPISSPSNMFKVLSLRGLPRGRLTLLHVSEPSDVRWTTLTLSLSALPVRQHPPARRTRPSLCQRGQRAYQRQQR